MSSLLALPDQLLQLVLPALLSQLVLPAPVLLLVPLGQLAL